MCLRRAGIHTIAAEECCRCLPCAKALKGGSLSASTTYPYSLPVMRPLGAAGDLVAPAVVGVQPTLPWVIRTILLSGMAVMIC